MNQTFTGMTCGHCEKAVRAGKCIDPQTEVTIDRSLNKVDVVSTHPRDLLSKAIVEEGYTVAE